MVFRSRFDPMAEPSISDRSQSGAGQNRPLTMTSASSAAEAVAELGELVAERFGYPVAELLPVLF